MLSGNIRRMQFFYLSLKVGREDSSSITGQIFSKIVCYNANSKHGWKTNNIGSGLISLLMKLVQFILSFHICSTRFSSSLLSG